MRGYGMISLCPRCVQVGNAFLILEASSGILIYLIVLHQKHGTYQQDYSWQFTKAHETFPKFLRLGHCANIHSEELREKYKETSTNKELNYEPEWRQSLENFLAVQKARGRRLRTWLDHPTPDQKIHELVSTASFQLSVKNDASQLIISRLQPLKSIMK
jgi:hypothetical protein